MNLTLSRAMRKHRVAYAWWLLFPLGAHRFYLAERIGAGLFVAITFIAILLYALVGRLPAAGATLVLFLWALYDLLWIDRRITAYNKKLRMQVYLRESTPPPPGYRGRAVELDSEELIADYGRQKEHERGGHQPADRQPAGISASTPSFRQQEAMLRELSRIRRKRTSGEP